MKEYIAVVIFLIVFFGSILWVFEEGRSVGRDESYKSIYKQAYSNFKQDQEQKYWEGYNDCLWDNNLQ